MKLMNLPPECRNSCSRAMTIVCIVLTIALVLFFLKALSHAETSGGCSTKPVNLDKEYLDAEEAFKNACGKCHPAPDPALATCISGLKQEELLSIQDYLHMTSNNTISGLDCLEPEGKPLFERTCGECHALPDPAKPNCISEMSREDLSLVHTFMESVRKGKELYESRCSECHELISPSSHTFEYWSKHLCDEEGKLDSKSKQEMLLYLKSRSK